MEKFQGLPVSVLAALDFVSELARDAPLMLYHYTDSNGLKGILESHSLRATYIRGLSDSTEQAHGEDVVCRILKDFTDTALHNRIDIGMAAPNRYRGWFVTCFCMSPTLPNMWERYASRGSGYCLGFFGPEVPRPAGSLMFRVVYDDTDAMLIKCGRNIAKLIEEFPDDPLPFGLACGLASAIKRPSFKDENEWRVVVHSPPVEEISFRQGPNGIIPYINLKWNQTVGNSPLREVLCGPTIRCDDELKQTIRWMLKKFGFGFPPAVDVKAVRQPKRP
jgi:hypothetical protein